MGKNYMNTQKTNFLAYLALILGFIFLGFPQAKAQVTIFSENMGTPTGTTAIASFTGWQNQGVLTYSNGGQANPADIRNSSISSGYTGASGGGNVWFTTTSGAYGFSIEGINASTFSGLSLNYGYYKNSSSSHATFSVDYWNGTSWVTLANTTSALFTESGTATTGWYPAKSISLPAAAQINGLKIRFVKTGTLAIRIDDVVLTGNSAALITVNSTFSSSLTSTYGTASSAQSVAVTGSGLSANIIATSNNSNIEISTDGTTYGSTATYTPTSNNVSGTLYARIKATVAVGNYNSASITLTSTNATSKTVSTTASGNTVSAKGLTITGITATNKTYNKTNSASFTGTATLSGVVGSDVVSIIGTPSATFAQSTVGTSIVVSVSGYSLTGTASGNYTLTQPTLSADITSKSATISGLSVADKPLDGNTNATLVGTPSLNGIISGDNVSLGGFPIANFSSSSIGSNIPVSVTGYVLTGTDNGNYSLTQPSLTGNIVDTSKLNQTISFGTLSAVTYGDANFNLSATSTSGLTVTYTSSNTSVAIVTGNSVTIVGPGTTTITANQSGNSTYNSATSVNQSLTVNVKNLTVTSATAQNKTYDGNTTATITGATLVGVVGSDVVTVSGNGTFTSANAGTGISVSTNLTLGGSDAAKYSLTQPAGLSANITKASQTITFNALAAKNSNDAPFTLTATSNSGLSVSFASLDTNTLKISGTTATIASYGSVVIAATQLGNNNYDSASTVYQTLVINRVASTIAAWEVNGVSGYGSSPFTPTTSDTNVTMVGLTRGSGFALSGTAASNAWGGSCTIVANKAAAISGNSFWTFSVAPKANRKVSFASLDTVWIRRPASGHNAGQWQYQINNNGFVDFGSQLAFVKAGSTTLRDTILPISLSGISALQNIEEGTTVTFRLVLWGATSPTGTTYITNFTNKVGNDLVVNGFVEPNYKPTLVVPNTSFAAFNQSGTTPTSGQTFTVNGQYLQSSVGVKAPTGFQVSSDNITFADSVNLAVTSGMVNNGPVAMYVRLNAPALGSYSGNITISSTNATAKTLAVTGARTGTFYSKSTGNLQDLSTWGFNSDGTGNAPLNFTTGGATYQIANRTSVTLDTILNITGGSTQLIIGDSINPISVSITANGGISATTKINANATVITESSNIPTWSYIGSNATIEYKNIALAIPALSYKNLKLSGTGTKTFAGGTTTITGDLTLDNATIDGGNPTFSTLKIGGNITYIGTVTPPATANSITLEFTDTNAVTRTIDADSNIVRWFRITAPKNATIDIQNASQVYLGNTSGGGFNIADGAMIKLNGADFLLHSSTGTSTAFNLNNTGKLHTNSASDFVLNRSGNGNLGTLRFDASGNTLGSFTLNHTNLVNNLVTFGSDVTISGDLTLTAGKIAILNNNLTLSGSNINATSGKIGADSGTVTFANAAPLATNKNIFVSNPYHMVMNSTDEVSFNSGLTINGNITFTSGLLSTTDSNIVVIGNMNGGNAISYFKSTGAGKLKHAVNQTSTIQFPVGNSNYNAVSITNNSGNSDNFSVRVLDQVYNNGYSGVLSTKDRINRTWDISKETANAGSGVDFTFNWNGSAEEIGTVSNPILNHFNSTTGKWEMPAVTRAAFTSGQSVTFTGYTGTFSPFGVGTGQALPVTWVSFKGQAQENNTLLTWTTASENRNDHFEVERSLDAKNFEMVQTLASKGNQGGQYSFIDAQANQFGKVIYYRLKQVDIDGSATYSNTVVVSFNNKGIVVGSLFPVPCHDVLNANISASNSGKAIVRVSDISGKEVSTQIFNLNKGSNMIELNTTQLPSGMYFMNITADGVSTIVKFSK